MNTAFFNLPDFLKIGLMAALFLAMVKFLIVKTQPANQE